MGVALEIPAHPHPAKLFHLLSPGLWLVTHFSGPGNRPCAHGNTNWVGEPLKMQKNLRVRGRCGHAGKESPHHASKERG